MTTQNGNFSRQLRPRRHNKYNYSLSVQNFNFRHAEDSDEICDDDISNDEKTFGTESDESKDEIDYTSIDTNDEHSRFIDKQKRKRQNEDSDDEYDFNESSDDDEEENEGENVISRSDRGQTTLQESFAFAVLRDNHS